MLDPEDMLTEAEAARKMRRSRLWLQRRRLDGIGPRFIMLGNRPLYDPADVSAWLEAQKQDPNQQTEA